MNAGSNNILISVNISTGEYRTTLGGLKVSPRDVGTILMARRRGSRVSNIHIFTSECGAPICTSPTALRRVRGGNTMGKGIGSFRVGNALSLNSVYTRTFRGSRSSTSYIKCRFAISNKHGVSIYASANCIASSTGLRIANSSLIFLRSGRRVSVLRGNYCPCPLGGHVLSSGKRLSGATTSTFTGGLLRDNAAEFILSRLDHRGGIPRVTHRSVVTTLSRLNTGRNRSCHLCISGPIDSKNFVIL